LFVREFWTLTGSNDFASVQAPLAEQFILEWPSRTNASGSRAVRTDELGVSGAGFVALRSG
jgi:hypothetical protein